MPKSVIDKLRLTIFVAYVVLLLVAAGIGALVARYGGSEYWGAAASLLVALFAFYLILPRLMARLETTIQEVISSARAISQGDFNRRITEIGDDELSELASSMNRLAESLKQSLEEIETAAQDVASSAHQILSAAEEQQHVATQQSASLHETATTVEELDLSGRQAAENAQEVVSRTEKASQQVLALSEKAQRVNKVSEVIDEVSRQIRILALNASIEAARAENNGGGFSVIASEIRRLADDTRKSTSEIDALVQDMQESTSSSVMIMEQTVESVKVIGLAMSQQSVATGQITEAMSEMNNGMKQAVESMRNTVQAGEELNRLAISLQRAIRRLRRIHGELPEEEEALPTLPAQEAEKELSLAQNA